MIEGIIARKRKVTKLMVLGLMLGGLIIESYVSAVTYQTGVGVSFTFNPKLTLSLSSSNLLIPSLAPGTTGDSNEITITISTNAAYGYNLSATVGNSTTYNNTDLTHTSGSSAGKFTSIAYESNPSNYISSFTTDNTWGYSIDSGTKYNGLPLYSDTTNIATLKSTDTTPSTGTDTVNFLIGAKASTTQPTGDYKNVINFKVVTNPLPHFLYDEVASMSRGTLASRNITLLDKITRPTSTNRAEDTSNSGVYEYEPGTYGIASDAANTRKIYFYRGILEPTSDRGSYGSDGKATTYPNYVKLNNNTCWRIVRTTGSGGVKMIYNGNWTGSTCANSLSNALIGTQAFASEGSSSESTWWFRNVTYVGYTYNDNVTDSTVSTSVDTVFGNNSNPNLNNTRSNIKVYIEDTWYANNMIGLADKLEASAGYCSDRTTFSNVQLNPTPLTSITPLLMTNATMYFGPRERVAVSGAKPSLTCKRSNVDLYHYVANSSGVGNELKYPVALLTVDEAALAGSGYSLSTTVYNSYSFLNDGHGSWLLSPEYRSPFGNAFVFAIGSNGQLDYNDGDGLYLYDGVRPVISLIPGTEIVDGSGTATDPWTIK